MNQKPFKNWTFEELVNYCAGEILKELIAGRFKTGVFCALDLCARWNQEQESKKEKRK